jgi:DNA-binding LytR/AlgR family response regulator
MKIRLAISDENMDEVKEFLESKGIEIDDDSEYTLIQRDKAVGHISVKNPNNGDKAFISVDDILYIESYGHQIEITTTNGMYLGRDPLYQLEGLLEKRKFTRVSKSSIISKKHVKKINPSLAMKFTLIMSDGRKIDVTRNYYNSFKEAFNI